MWEGEEEILPKLLWSAKAEEVRGGAGRRDERVDLLYTTLRRVKCNRVVNCNRFWRVGITAVTSVFIQASLFTHNFENFVVDLYGIESYEARIPILFKICFWDHSFFILIN